MDEVPCDFRELLEFFNARQVEYLVVGAYALAFHGAPRATGDIDLLIKPDLANATRMLAALADFGFASLGLKPEEMAIPEQVLQLGYEPVRVDIITSLTSLSWEEAWASRQAGSIGGVPVHFIGRDAYLANKQASGRRKDLADIEALGELHKPGRKRKGPRK